MLTFVDIPVSQGGPPGCRACSPQTPAELSFRSPGDIENDLDRELGGAAGAGVFFTGSDALAHPDIVTLARRAIQAGATRIAVRTGGRALEDPAFVASLFEAGIHIFEFPVLGSCAQTHDPLHGVPGSFDLVDRGVRLVLDAAEAHGVRVAARARVGVCRHTVHDLPATVMRLAELHFTSVVLECPPEPGSRRFADWVAAACDTGTVNRVWVSVSGLDPALLGDKALHAVDVLETRGGTR